METDDAPVRPLSRLNDPEALRGVPCVGPGIRGAIRGTVPGARLL